MIEPGPPPVIEGYRILGPLGRGSMGTVWRAVDRKGREVAVKVFDRAKRVGEELRDEMSRREAVASLNLHHESLVRGLEVGETSERRMFLALELVEGETLTRRIRLRGPMPEGELVPIAHALAGALEHAHALGLLHRDVKPDNVMLTAGGGTKLIDFSLVTEIGFGELGCGSPGYASPEMIRKQEVGAPSDLYALGLTLAAATMGRPYFDGATAKDVLRESLTKPLVLPPAVAGVAISGSFRALVARLGRKDPAERYGSAAELRLDLEALMHGERPLGAHLVPHARPPRASRRRRAIWLGAALVGGGALVAVYVRSNSVGTPADAPADARVPVATTPSTVAQAPTSPGEAEVGAALLYASVHAEEFANSRRVLEERLGANPSASQRERLESALRALDARFAAAADAALAERRASARVRADQGDLDGMARILESWPAELSKSPQADEARVLAKAWRAQALEPGARLLIDGTEALIRWDGARDDDVDEARVLLARVDAILPSAPREPTQRAALTDLRARLATKVESLVKMRRAHSTREAVARALDSASADRAASRATLASLAATTDDADSVARLVADVLSKGREADRRLASKLAQVSRRPWARLADGRVLVGSSAAPPDTWLVFGPARIGRSGSPWRALEFENLLAEERDLETAASWLVFEGRPDEADALAQGSGNTRRLLGLSTTKGSRSSEGVAAATELSRRFDLAVRAPDGAVPAAEAADGPDISAWIDVLRPSVTPRRSATPAGKPPPELERARASFLRDDWIDAWAALEKSSIDAPRDAEIAILRCRVLDALAEPYPTIGIELFGLSEARRAWDLDPSVPAGSRMVAERALRIRRRHPGEIAAALAPVTLVSCEEAVRLGQATPAMLAYVGERRLADARGADAAALLRKASLAAPDDGEVLLLLARAEIQVADFRRAREALERARKQLGEAFPTWARDTLAEIGKR